MRLFLAVPVVLFACCATASAGPGLILGVADDDLKWTEDTKAIVLDQQAVGFRAVRVTLEWQQGQTRLDDEGRTYMRRAQAAAKLGHRVVVGVFGDPASPPVTPEARTQYCSYIADALSRARNVTDVVIWNEANSALFWRPQQGAAAAYEALLAECYDTLHSYRRTVNVITSTSPHEDPGRFLRALGDAYRASGRAAPLFDTLGHNAYPETTRESPYAAHTTPSLDQGDYVRLLGVLTAAFSGTAQPVPGSGTIETPASGSGRKAEPALSRPVTIWYLEDGFETVVASDKRAGYTGREPNRQLVQALAPRTRAAAVVPDQASQLKDAVELAFCQPAVGAFFNFQLKDEAGLGGWQSGLLWADGTPKPSYDPVKAVLAAVAAATVDCSRFPLAATGPRIAPATTTPAVTTPAPTTTTP
jgi:hypothetical protein